MGFQWHFCNYHSLITRITRVKCDDLPEVRVSGSAVHPDIGHNSPLYVSRHVICFPLGLFASHKKPFLLLHLHSTKLYPLKLIVGPNFESQKGHQAIKGTDMHDSFYTVTCGQTQ